MILANVILATQLPYVMVLLFCILVVPIEVAVFFVAQRPIVGFARSLGLVVLANVVSWIAGMFITALVPCPVNLPTTSPVQNTSTGSSSALSWPSF